MMKEQREQREKQLVHDFLEEGQHGDEPNDTGTWSGGESPRYSPTSPTLEDETMVVGNRRVSLEMYGICNQITYKYPSKLESIRCISCIILF